MATPAALEALDWYHTLDLPGHTTAGVYDHRKVDAFYGFPANLRGKRALDVGAGDGYFSFLFEELGAAEVVSLNPPSWGEEDHRPVSREAWRAENTAQPLVDKFELARALLDSRARQIKGNVYDLSAAEHGRFELVFCGSVLCHLTDPLRALFRLREVTSGLCIIATPVDQHEPQDLPTALFVGAEHSHTFWIPNERCLHQMLLAAGFANVTHVSTFNLISERGEELVMPHAVFHAFA